MHLNILLAKCLPQVSDLLILFLRDQDKNEAHETVRPKVILTVHWGGRQQRECSLAGSRWRASRRRWPTGGVSWQTWCSCPHWWQRARWWPHWAKAWWPFLPVNEDEKRPLEGRVEIGRSREAWWSEAQVGTGGERHFLIFENWYLKWEGIQRPLFSMFLGFFSVARKLLGGQRPN